ncbi:MAG: class I SAM-dependent methyltransferase [Thermoplasmata archaeon]|nr:MAG: class I SAM-dependent methyltransferase [Thermoplasmata archaeon]
MVHDGIKDYWNARDNKLFEKGKISYLDPHKIGNQGILDALKGAEKYAKGELLDIGCGTKPYQDLFKNVDRYIGIDMPAENNKSADIFGDGLKLPFRSNVIDTILSTQVIEHVEEPKEILNEAYRVLKTGGHLILTAPMVWELHVEPYDYYRFTKYGLKYLAKSTGFHIIEIKAETGCWGVIGQRMSDYAYTSKGAPKSLLGEIFKRSLCASIQLFFMCLDKICRNEKETLGYIMVARK